MASLQEAANLALSLDFRNRITAGLVFVARDVIEDIVTATGPEDPNRPSALSEALARSVLSSPTNQAAPLTWLAAVLIAAEDIDLTTVTDAQVISALRLAWPYVARLNSTQ